MRPPKLHSIEQAAAQISPELKPSTLRRLAAARRIDVTIMGGKLWMTDAQIAAAVEECTRPATRRTTSTRTKSNRRKPAQAPPLSSVEVLLPELGSRYGKAGLA